MRPSNLPLSFIGACLLWIGWFGFNAGSALTASSLAASAFTVTHFGAAAGVMGWLAVEWIRNRRPSMLGGITGAGAGLVSVTPGAGFVTPMAGLLIGFTGGAACYYVVAGTVGAVLKSRMGYDEIVDAVIGLRVAEADERIGLDLTQHGEEAYVLDG